MSMRGKWWWAPEVVTECGATGGAERLLLDSVSSVFSYGARQWLSVQPAATVCSEVGNHLVPNGVRKPSFLY